MPELEDSGDEKKSRVDLKDGERWRKCTIEGVALDGRVKVRYDDDPARAEDVELDKRRYHWLYGEDVSSWGA